jgi:hypothetical protein
MSRQYSTEKDVDGRDKPGHDENGSFGRFYNKAEKLDTFPYHTSKHVFPLYSALFWIR